MSTGPRSSSDFSKDTRRRLSDLGNPSIERKVRAKYVEEPKRAQQNGLDPAIFEYVGRAIRALEG